MLYEAYLLTRNSTKVTRHATQGTAQYLNIGPMLLGVALLLLVATSHAQMYTFRVLDQNNQPLPLAVIAVPLYSNTLPSDTLPSNEMVSVSSQERVMDQVNIAFEPHVLVINQGDLVDFPNSDNLRHHVYSFSAPKSFEIKLYAITPEAPISFPTPGIVVLGCNIHDTMLGYIYVSDTPYTAITDSNGIAQIELSQAPTALDVWHERHSLIESIQMHMDEGELNRSQTTNYHFEITHHTAVAAAIVKSPKQGQSHEHHGLGNSMRR